MAVRLFPRLCVVRLLKLIVWTREDPCPLEGLCCLLRSRCSVTHRVVPPLLACLGCTMWYISWRGLFMEGLGQPGVEVTFQALFSYCSHTHTLWCRRWRPSKAEGRPAGTKDPVRLGAKNILHETSLAFASKRTTRAKLRQVGAPKGQEDSGGVPTGASKFRS